MVSARSEDVWTKSSVFAKFFKDSLEMDKVFAAYLLTSFLLSNRFI